MSRGNEGKFNQNNDVAIVIPTLVIAALFILCVVTFSRPGSLMSLLFGSVVAYRRTLAKNTV